MGIKDKIISTAAEKFLKSYIEDFGELINFDIDTDKKNIKMKLSLVGEPEQFLVEIKGYNFTEDGQKTFLEINDLESSKEWMKIAFRKYFKNKRIEIPEQYSKWLDYIT